MEERDLSEQNDPDSRGANERPNNAGERYDPQPDSSDVRQNEEYDGPLTVVPVCVEKPVRAQLLPAVDGGSRKYELTTSAVRILTADPRRRRAVLQATGDDNFVIAGTKAEANGPYAASFQSFTLLELTACGEFWARAESTTVTLSVLNEQWAG